MIRVTQEIGVGLPKKMVRTEGYPKLVQHRVTRGSTSWKVLSDDNNFRQEGRQVVVAWGYPKKW